MNREERELHVLTIRWLRYIGGELGAVRRTLNRIARASERTAVATEAIAAGPPEDRRAVVWHVSTPEPE
jgi:hypothetical protein